MYDQYEVLIQLLFVYIFYARASCGFLRTDRRFGHVPQTKKYAKHADFSFVGGG